MKILDFKFIVLAIIAVMAIYSCREMDDYKKYIEGDPVINYTGKVDSVEVYPGHNRLVLKGLMVSDPNIVEARVFWNSGRDSLVIPVTRTSGVDTLVAQISNLPEGVYNFEIMTYNHLGDKSVKTYKIGRSYGENYRLSLMNRPPIGATTDANGTTIATFSELDAESGAFGTDIKYTTTADLEKIIVLPLSSTSLTLPEDYKEGTALHYRTKYLPDSLAIDTFYTDYVALNVRRYVTEQYLANYAAPFATSVCSGSRWCIPSDWIVNDAAKNFTTGGVKYGGVDANQSHRLSMEAGWSTTLVSFTNGKIYQTAVLPAGEYDFEVNINGAGTSGSFYIVAAEGSEIPNIEDLADGAISYLSFVGKNGTQSIKFTLVEPTTVSLGFVGSLTGSSSTGQYWKVQSVALKHLQLN